MNIFDSVYDICSDYVSSTGLVLPEIYLGSVDMAEYCALVQSTVPPHASGRRRAIHLGTYIEEWPAIVPGWCRRVESTTSETWMPLPHYAVPPNPSQPSPFTQQVGGNLYGVIRSPINYIHPTAKLLEKRVDTNLSSPHPSPQCECGSDKVGSPQHSTWCPKHRRDIWSP